MKRCICLHYDHDHTQLPAGEFAGPCQLCPCRDFKSAGSTTPATPAMVYRKSEPADREGLERLLAKRLRRRFEVLFDEEVIGSIAAALIQTAWSMGWDECRASYAEETEEEEEAPPKEK